MYIEKRLKELDLQVMEAFVIKEVETVEQHTSLFTCVLLKPPFAIKVNII